MTSADPLGLSPLQRAQSDLAQLHPEDCDHVQRLIAQKTAEAAWATAQRMGLPLADVLRMLAR